MGHILEMALMLKQQTIAFRRDLHMYPELSFEEFQTSAKVKRELDRMGIPYRAVTETGIVAEITGETSGKTVALRADMDALEIQEKTSLDFQSKHPGLMHACGHDGHTAALLAAADILNRQRENFGGKVKLIFQPGEEKVQGALRMTEADPFMDGVDSILGLHLISDYPCGSICWHDGEFMFGGEKFDIHVDGMGGHGAQPHRSIDALLVASAIVMNSQAILGREIDPNEVAVATIGMLTSGTRHNVIAGEADMTGTIRYYNEETRAVLKESLTRMVENTAKTYRAKGEIAFSTYVPPLFNDPAFGAIVRKSAAKIVGEKNVVNLRRGTGSDDFAYYLRRTPGYYAVVGCGNAEKNASFPHHHPNFALDEDSLPIAAAFYAQYALDYLSGNLT